MSRRDTASIALGFAAIAAATLAVGGALRWAQALVAALAIAALIPAVRSRRVFAKPSPLLAMLGIAIGATILQLVPARPVLPLVQDTGSALRDAGAALFGETAWPSISLDTPGTLRALAGLCALLGLALVGLRLAATERGRYQILAGVAALCGATALIVGAHRVVGATALYGIYEPSHAGPHLLGPLLNLNHLGGLMAVGALLAGALAMYQRQPSWARVVWVATALGCGAITLLTVSRGATIALGVGGLVTAGALVGQRFLSVESPRTRRGQFLTSTLPIGVVGVCVVVLVVYASASNVGRALSQTGLSELSAPKTKFAAWESSIELIRESPLLGIGRGAFESSFTRVHPASSQVTFSHVENEYLQAVIDWGIPAAILLGFAAIWLAVTAIRRWRDGPLAAGALGALAAVAVQANVDFGLELLGLAAPVTAIAATVAYTPLQEATGRALLRARALRVGLVGALAFGVWALLSPMTRSIDEDHALLHESPTEAVIRDAAARHPLDYYVYAVTAERMARAGDPRAVGFLNHALVLHPTHAGLHRLAARLLFRLGHLEQAAAEYAQALRATPNPQRLLVEILALMPAKLAAESIPIDVPNADPILRVLAEELRPDVATEYLARVLALHPDDPRACDALYASAIRTGELRQISLAATKCPTVVPDHPARVQLAKIMLGAQQWDEALRILSDVEDWRGRVDEKIAGWLERCDAYIGMRSFDEAKRCLRRLDVSGVVPVEQRIEVTARLERVEEVLRASPTPPTPPAP